MAEQLVRIVRRTQVEAIGIALPQPARPTLVLNVRFEPGHRIDYDFAWDYDGLDPLPYRSDSLDHDDSVGGPRPLCRRVAVGGVGTVAVRTERDARGS